MPEPTINDELTTMLREFISAAREKIKERIANTDPEELVERTFGALAAAAAAALLLLPFGKAKEGWIGALLSAAMRFLARKSVPRV